MENTGRRSLIDSVWRLFLSASQLAMKQAELTIFNYATLPKLNCEIGKRVAQRAEHPPELVPFCDRIQYLEAVSASQRFDAPAAPENTANSLASKAKLLCRKTAHMAWMAASQSASYFQIQAAYMACGKEAVRLFGDRAIPTELQREWSAAEERLKALTVKINELQDANAVMAVTPRRLVSVSQTLAAVLLALFLLRSVGTVIFGGSVAGGAQQASTEGVSDRTRPKIPTAVPKPVDKISNKASTSLSDASQHDFAISNALAKAIRQESDHFTSDVFRGLKIGDRYADDPGKSNAAFESPFLLSVPPHRATEGPDGKPEETRAIVEKESGRIVGVSCLYEGSALADLIPDLIQQFGKTRQEVDVSRWQQSGGPAQAETVKYTFPHAIVRVTGYAFSRPYPIRKTRITVVDRPFVEKWLAAHGQSVVQACLWLQRTRYISATGRIDQRNAVPLKGCEIRVFRSSDGESLLYVDSKREAGVKQAMERIRKQAGAEHGLGLGGALQPFDVAYVNSSERAKQLIVCPDASGAMRGPELKSFMEHLDGSIMTFPPLRDIVMTFTSSVVQEMLPPDGDISVVTQTSDWLREPDYDVAMDRRVLQITSRADGDRHEWTDREGWQVRVTERGAVSLMWKQGRGL